MIPVAEGKIKSTNIVSEYYGSADCNSFIDQRFGIYYSTPFASNYPDGGGYGTLIVIPRANANLIQVYISTDGAGAWLRCRVSSGSFTTWKKFTLVG